MDDEDSLDEDDQSSLEALEFDADLDDDAINGEALNKERLIRQIVASCIEQELPAETIRLNLLGLCRSLGALSQLAADESSHKQTCMEAAGVIAMTSSCERMLRSVSGFELIQQYRFTHDPDA